MRTGATRADIVNPPPGEAVTTSVGVVSAAAVTGSPVRFACLAAANIASRCAMTSLDTPDSDVSPRAGVAACPAGAGAPDDEGADRVGGGAAARAVSWPAAGSASPTAVAAASAIDKRARTSHRRRSSRRVPAISSVPFGVPRQRVRLIVIGT